MVGVGTSCGARRATTGNPCCQAERDRLLAQLSDKLALKSTLLEQDQANTVEVTKRAGLLETHVHVLRDHAALDAKLREQADRLLALTSLVGQKKDAELVNVQVQLEELLHSRDQHARVLEQAQSALQTAIAEPLQP